MSNEPNYDNMSVKECKRRIERAKLSHSDCVDTRDLRQRAKEADEVRSGNNGKNDKVELRERRGKGGKPSSEELVLIERVNALTVESTKVVGGRDASVILAEADELKAKLAELSLTEAGSKQMTESLDELKTSLAFENHMEKNCGRFIQLAFLAMTFLPAMISCFEQIYEWKIRPEMVVEPANLSNIHAVVTGGCGALGLQLAIMLANSGAGVVISCHGPRKREPYEVESQLSKLGLLHGSTRSDESDPDQGWVKVLPLQLESFASVREFASRAVKELGGTVDLLVHNAATKDGCSRTVDGHQLVTQVNYLSPFLLNHLLVPAFREGSARVVHVTCDAGIAQPDWLPWPLSRTQPELMPRVNFESLKKRRDGNATDNCSPLVEYANSKLAIVVHSHELNRLLSGYENRGVSHAVNPGAMDSPFGRSESVATGKPSARSSMMGYLPPVWIANQVYSFTLGKAFTKAGNFMLRHTAVGAKAVFHVATLTALGDEEQGGGLFSDKVGMFTDCGLEPGECGRLPVHQQPVATQDQEMATELWAATETAIGHKHLRPLPEHEKAGDDPFSTD